MTATILEEAQTKLQGKVDAYKMPHPKKGELVLWFPNADKGQEAEIGFIMKVGQRNVVIKMASGMSREAVFHIDDPRLQQNEFVRQNGAWDFTETDMGSLTKDVLELQQTVADLKKRLAAVEGKK